MSYRSKLRACAKCERFFTAGICLVLHSSDLCLLSVFDSNAVQFLLLSVLLKDEFANNCVSCWQEPQIAHVQLSPFNHLSTLDVMHVRKHTRPFVFFRATESSMRAWERGYMYVLYYVCLKSCKGTVLPAKRVHFGFFEKITSNRHHLCSK